MHFFAKAFVGLLSHLEWLHQRADHLAVDFRHYQSLCIHCMGQDAIWFKPPTGFGSSPLGSRIWSVFWLYTSWQSSEYGHERTGSF